MPCSLRQERGHSVLVVHVMGLPKETFLSRTANDSFAPKVGPRGKICLRPEADIACDHAGSRGRAVADLRGDKRERLISTIPVTFRSRRCPWVRNEPSRLYPIDANQSLEPQRKAAKLIGPASPAPFALRSDRRPDIWSQTRRSRIVGTSRPHGHDLDVPELVLVALRREARRVSLAADGQ